MYRRFLLRSARFRLISFIVLGVIIVLLNRKMHDFMHAKADLAERRVKLAQQWLNFPKPTNLASEISYGLLVRQILWEIDGEIVGLHDAPKPWAHMREYGHHSWLSKDGDPHPRIYGCIASKQVVIVIPYEKPHLHWMNLYPNPMGTMYVSAESQGAEKLSDLKLLDIKSSMELDLIALGYVSSFAPAFRARMKAIEDERPTRFLQLNDFLHTPMAYVLYSLLALILFLGSCVDSGLHGQVAMAAQEYGLDQQEQQTLFEQGRPFWLSHRSRTIVARKLDALARALFRERQRAERRQRSAQLRALADEQKSKQLEEMATKRAKQAAQRIVARQSTLSKEIGDLRRAMSGEPSEIGRVIKTEFIDQVTVEVEDRQKPLHESGDDAQATRAKHLLTVMASTRELAGLDTMKEADLETLARVIRPMKRHLSRDAFRGFVEQFEGGYEKTYRHWLDLALRGQYAELEHALLQKPELTASSDETVFEDPTLLKGMNVLLVGGIPSISAFYLETIRSLGANDATHAKADENLPRQRRNLTHVFLFAGRCAHAHQVQAKAMGLPLVYLDRLSLSTFKRGLITAVHQQLL